MTDVRRKPSAFEMSVLLFFHAAISGAFFVAYFTGDEDTYGMHVFAGYTVLAALALRLVAGLFAPSGSPLRLPRPHWGAALDYTRRLLAGEERARRERSPLYAWMAAIVLVATALAAASGAGADFLPRLEGLHEALGEIALWVAIGHIAIVSAVHARKLRRAPAALPATNPAR